MKLIFFAIFISTANAAILNEQGKRLPINTYQFLDETGNSVALSQYFQPNRPVFLAPVYFQCSGICTLTLNTLFNELQRLKLNPGKAYEVIVFTIDPSEKPELAQAKKKTYLEKYHYENYSNGFHFLTADQAQIDSLTKALSFEYTQVGNQFSHSNAIYLLSSEGVISKKMGKLHYSTRKLREYLSSAANGRTVSAFERMVITCRAEVNSAENWLTKFIKTFSK